LGAVGSDEHIRQLNIMMEHFLHISVDNLNDEEWAMRVGDVQWLINKLYPPKNKK
jgi:hypothetical protein